MSNPHPVPPVVVAALYHFARLDNVEALQEPLLQVCRSQGVKGTLLLAREGINGTVAGTRTGIDAVLAWLRSDPRLSKLEHKESLHSENPFHRMKVRLKPEIVTLGLPDIDPATQAGAYVDPEDWNALLSDPEVILIDTRNHYECAIGAFRGAINPHTASFREFPAYVDAHLDPAVHKKVAMYCTGGIRCEKATALLRQHGFESVYHLKGGILKYLETVPAEESRWEGQCFVFDERVSVGHDLTPGDYVLCRGCRMPVSPADQQSPRFREGVCCPRCADALTPDLAARRAERHRQVQLAAARNELHVGRPARETDAGRNPDPGTPNPQTIPETSRDADVPD